MCESTEKGFFAGMTKEQINDFEQAQEQMEQMEKEQYAKDTKVIRMIKKTVPKKLFKQISTEIWESDHFHNLRITDEPFGDFQGLRNAKGIKVWVDQCTGLLGDDFSGTVCVELPDGKYLAWDYEC